MSLIASAPDGLSLLGWWRLAGVTVAFCLAPAALGVLGLAAVHLIGPDGLGNGFLYIGGVATLAIASPLVTLPVWVLIGLGTGWLMRQGRYGALPALVLGACVGGLAGWQIDQPLAAPLAAVLATLHRFTLALLRPLAF